MLELFLFGWAVIATFAAGYYRNTLLQSMENTDRALAAGQRALEIIQDLRDGKVVFKDGV